MCQQDGGGSSQKEEKTLQEVTRLQNFCSIAQTTINLQRSDEKKERGFWTFWSGTLWEGKYTVIY